MVLADVSSGTERKGKASEARESRVGGRRKRADKAGGGGGEGWEAVGEVIKQEPVMVTGAEDRCTRAGWQRSP